MKLLLLVPLALLLAACSPAAPGGAGAGAPPNDPGNWQDPSQNP